MSACPSQLHLADDYGDNHCTLRCQLENEHDGKHQEKFRFNEGETGARCCVIEWVGDDSEETTTRGESDDDDEDGL